MDDAPEQGIDPPDQALQRQDFETALHRLERAQVQAQAHAQVQVQVQRMTGLHTLVRWRMFVTGLRRGDPRELVGQPPRNLVLMLLSRRWVPCGPPAVRSSALSSRCRCPGI